MKQPLPILGEPGRGSPPPPIRLTLGSLHVALLDTGHGAAARAFAHMLEERGAAVDEDGARPADLTIVIRDATARIPREDADALERAADVVLGSARPAFAAHLAARGGVR